ncbi:MAG TPA: sugar ABC transporter substrate-binding protein [Firmicutes bacterium]|nr:sugar ABC transporter substrate-binding protein [Bacillota bacterium]
MKKHIILLSSLLLILTLLVSGCQSQSTQPEQSADNGAEKGRNVTMILKNLVNPFCVTVKEGAEAAAEELNVNLTVLTPLQTDSNEELSQLTEQAVASGECDVLIMFPSDSTGIVPAVQKVYEAGIPIVSLNTKINSDTVMWETYVAAENYDVGYMTCKRLCEAMEGKGQLMLIEGVTGAQNSIDRIAGAKEAAKEFPDIKIVAQQAADFNRAKGMDVVQNLLQAHPDVKGIMCCNDEMAMGAIEAIEAAGKSGQILVSGVDVNADARVAIREGKLAFSCDVGAYDQGYQAVAAAAKILDGEKVPERIATEIKVVGIDEIEDYD